MSDEAEFTTIPLPENVHRLGTDDTFQFRCHPGVRCFTECCRLLDLALTPYDVLRLKHGLGLPSNEFLEQFVVFEQEEHESFPQAYLMMGDDGRGSCPFVLPSGCRIYEHRPGACRTYPLGRAASLGPDGRHHDFYVLLTEPHCQGFSQPQQQTIRQWVRDQALGPYNTFNDAVMTVLQHDQIKNGLRLNRSQTDKFILALYNLDRFRIFLEKQESNLSLPTTMGKQRVSIAEDETLLRLGIRWLHRELFGE